MAVCGGHLRSGGTASCLVLDKETGTWDGSRLGSLTQPRDWHTAVTLENIGNYLIGGRVHSSWVKTTDYLAPGSQEWVSGPQLPMGMGLGPCSVVISDKSFLVIYGIDIREYQVDIGNPTSDNGWQEATKWPQLQTSRIFWPGCEKIGQNVVIAGGRSWLADCWTCSLRSTEILNLQTRTTQFAGDLTRARLGFHIFTITTGGRGRTFALGGQHDSSVLDSIEELDQDTLTWNTIPAKLAEERVDFGAVALSKSLLCQT